MGGSHLSHLHFQKFNQRKNTPLLPQRTAISEPLLCSSAFTFWSTWFPVYAPDGKKYSLWTLLLRHQSRHEWCVQSLRVEISQDAPSPSSCLLWETKAKWFVVVLYGGVLKKKTTLIHRCKADGWHVGKDTHSCPPRGKWSAGGLSCFSLQEPLEAVWRRDSVTKSLGNYCSFSREGPVVSPQYRHYQTSLVALTKSWDGRKKRQRGPQLEGLRVDQTGRRQHIRKENQRSERQTKQNNYSFFGLFF